jgi:antitoxin (DNA-binding transcriptional repressor) of toxin-antitoxin stability system
MTTSKTHLRRRTRELIDAVKCGNEVRIQSHGHPVAGLIPDDEPDPLPDEAAYAVRKEIFARILSRPQGPIDPTDIILDDRRRKADDIL